ncbi:hypothetical protein V1578_23860 [Enterobacter cloacae]
MGNWLALFDGQPCYHLEINDSSVKLDALNFTGNEALSEPFQWGIDFTTPQNNLAPEQVLMKYATLRMRSGKAVPVYTRNQENVELHVVQKKPQPRETLWFIGDGSEQQMETELREQP